MKNLKAYGAIALSLALLASISIAGAQTTETDPATGTDAAGTPATSSDGMLPGGEPSDNSFNTLNGTGTASEEEATFSIVRDEASVATSTEMDPADVSSVEDLESYARSLMASDENVVRIDAGDSFVSLWYKEPARFLGMIPVSVSVEATVRSDGTVSVAYPWWHSVFVKDEEASADLESELGVTAGTIARSEGITEFSSGVQARLINALRAGMKEFSDSNADSGTSTDDMTSE